MDTPTLQSRARVAAQALELERSAGQAARIEAARAGAARATAGLVAAWLAANRLDNAYTFDLGTMTTDPEGSGNKWRINVRIYNDHPNDDLFLTLALDLGQLHPEGTTTGHWQLPRTCPSCGVDYTIHAGWTLAEIGRAINRDLDHNCAAAATGTLIERHHLSGENPTPDAARRLDELEAAGYEVEALPDDGWLILIARPHLSVDQPF